MKTICSFLAACALNAGAQDYTAYNALLSKYVKADGVDYASWSSHRDDHQQLDMILKNWSQIDANQLARNDRAAFRINLYNASIIAIVLDKYPLESVTKIGIPHSIFKRATISTPQGKISLDTLEKKLLLKDFSDARVHFAVNCASASCPPLHKEAYRGAELGKQLDEQAKRFVNSSKALRIDGDTLQFSPIFKWYSADFAHASPTAIIQKYSQRTIPSDKKTEWQEYNWQLNAAKAEEEK